MFYNKKQKKTIEATDKKLINEIGILNIAL